MENERVVVSGSGMHVGKKYEARKLEVSVHAIRVGCRSFIVGGLCPTPQYKLEFLCLNENKPEEALIPCLKFEQYMCICYNNMDILLSKLKCSS